MEQHQFTQVRTIIVTLFAAIFQALYYMNVIRYLRVFPSIHIKEDNDLYPTVMTWISDRFQDRAQLEVEQPNGNAEEDEKGYKILDSFHKKDMRKFMRFMPSHGRYWFREHGRIFTLNRTLQSTRHQNDLEEEIVFSTLSWSTQPIKELLKEISTSVPQQMRDRTRVWMPRAKAQRGFRGAWRIMCSPRSRSLKSVNLSAELKKKIVEDMNEFLQPSTAAFYRSKSMNWRRGYMFYGPPGTGKTSFAKALAGAFGLDVYFMTLVDTDIQDAELVSFFSSIPERSILLLEDLDSTVSALDRLSEKRSDANSARISKTQITIGGLLGAIDGIASPEGVILIITTNHPDKLDKALTRPGRIDMKVRFTRATKDQLRTMFITFYESGPINPARLSELADQFSNAIPDDLLSPASVQNFLVSERRDPEEAVRKTEGWVRLMKEDTLSLEGISTPNQQD